MSVPKVLPSLAAYGPERDYATFYAALIPKQKTAVVPKAVVPLVDTVLMAKGKPIRWLHSLASNEATEKVHVDKESIHASFRQQGTLGPEDCLKTAGEPPFCGRNGRYFQPSGVGRGGVSGEFHGVIPPPFP
jgi:hypothetical protein